MREAESEVVDSQPTRRAIGGQAAKMFKQHLQASIQATGTASGLSRDVETHGAVSA